MASVHELDVTVQMRGENDDSIGDDDDTGVNPTVELNTEDKTIEMPAQDEDDNTAVLPRKGSKAS